MQPRYERLVETVRERTGPALRGVVAYGSDETALLYRREDLGCTANQRIHAAICAARERKPLLDGAGAEQRHASVELYGEAVIIHLPETEERGTLISLDPGVARQLGGFIEECTMALQAPETGYEAEPAPVDE